MELKQKLEITETSVNETRQGLRSVKRKLEFLRHHQETKTLVSKEELQKLEDIDNMLYEIELKINDIVTFDL